MSLKYDPDTWPPLAEGGRVGTLYEASLSDSERHYLFLRQLTRDGAEINCVLTNEQNVASIRIIVEEVKTHKSLALFPKAFKFLVLYLLTGDNSNFPIYPKDLQEQLFYLFSGNDDNIYEYYKKFQSSEFKTTDDYIYKHIKREIERGKYTYKEETQESINGIRFTGQYPYGSIDYGFIPHSWEELNALLENIEPYVYIYPEYDIPELHNTTLPTEYRELTDKKHLDSIFDAIPTNVIIDKTICGCGATWLEIHSKRNSIIIEPNVPVIAGKMQEHPHIIGVFGEELKVRDIAEKVQNQTGYVKIMTTPDSYPKVIDALKSLQIPYRQDYFLLFDECEKIVSDIDYRPNIYLPIDDFFKFRNKAMVSATPIVINDPKFEAQGFKIIKIEPLFDHKRLLELKPTNNINAMVRRTVDKIDKDTVICFFYNSVKGIKELIDLLGINDQSNIYCSTDAKKDLKKDGYTAFDSVTDNKGNATLIKYNFFTSRFYSAVDIKLDYKPIVIMITDVYKTVKDKTPYSLIDPETEAIQIAGRFRNGIDRLMHITNTNADTPIYPRNKLEEYLNEQHTGFLKLVALYDSLGMEGGNGEKSIIYEAIIRTDYFAEGFVNVQKEINYFRYNNFYLDERLKMLYIYPALLYKAYKRSKAFTVVSQSEYAVYTEEERRKLQDRSSTKAERITLLYKIIKHLADSDKFYDRKFIEELEKDYVLYFEAFATIGFAKVKELEFKDSDIRTAVNDFNFKRQVTSKEVKKAVYNVFKENTTYTTREIKDGLEEIFNRHNIRLHRQPQGRDILHYFEAEESRGTRGVRIWKLNFKR